jgi:hypothetical protein
MSAPARALGSLRIADNAVSASYEGVLDADRESQIVERAVAKVVDVVRPDRGIVVELKPRTFTETATHFVRATAPVEWPSEEHDID